MTMVNTEDLVDAPAIAKRCGVDQSTVRGWLNRHEDFPEPILTLGIGRVWLFPRVEKWRIDKFC